MIRIDVCIFGAGAINSAHNDSTPSNKVVQLKHFGSMFQNFKSEA